MMTMTDKTLRQTVDEIIVSTAKPLTYTPGDLAKAPRKWVPKPVSVDLSEYGRRDKAWAALRKMVAAGRSNRQLDRAARALN